MKLLKIKTLGILKLALLFSLFISKTQADQVLLSDRFIFKVMDDVYSLQDLNYQSRNLNALKCVYPDAFVLRYFGEDFLKKFKKFNEEFPQENSEAIKYLHLHEDLLRQIRFFFKGMKYAEDQKLVVSEDVTKIIIEATKVNKCDTKILKDDGLKANFISLLRLELYLRSRYAPQMDSKKIDFNTVKSSIDLFIESLDKQFSHEYFW